MRLIPWLGGAEDDKASKFSEAQKAFILNQGSDGVPVAEHLPEGWDKSGDQLRALRGHAAAAFSSSSCSTPHLRS